MIPKYSQPQANFEQIHPNKNQGPFNLESTALPTELSCFGLWVIIQPPNLCISFFSILMFTMPLVIKVIKYEKPIEHLASKKTSNDIIAGNGRVLKVYVFIMWPNRFAKLVHGNSFFLLLSFDVSYCYSYYGLFINSCGICVYFLWKKGHLMK